MNNLIKALIKFQGKIQSVGKGTDNPFFHSKYADLAEIWDTIRQPLSDSELAVTQATEISQTTGELSLRTTLWHSSGESISSLYPIIPIKKVKEVLEVVNDPQGIGSAVTYARRYALSALLGITATNEDDDGERAMGRGGNTQPAAKPAYPAKTATREQSPKGAATKSVSPRLNELKAELLANGDGRKARDWWKANAGEISTLTSLQQGELLEIAKGIPTLTPLQQRLLDVPKELLVEARQLLSGTIKPDILLHNLSQVDCEMIIARVEELFEKQIDPSAVDIIPMPEEIR